MFMRFVPQMKSIHCIRRWSSTRAKIIWKFKVVGEDALMSLNGAVLVTLKRRMPCILEKMSVNVIGWAEQVL